MINGQSKSGTAAATVEQSGAATATVKGGAAAATVKGYKLLLPKPQVHQNLKQQTLNFKTTLTKTET
jgi:murein L,D-transpeptidase YafK